MNHNSDNSDKLEFQICDWNTYHEIDSQDDDKYVIQLFGRTSDDRDVCLKVTDFTPFFYVEIPQQWTDYQIYTFVKSLKRKVKLSSENNQRINKDLGKSLLQYKVVKKQKFYHFANKKMFRFLMLIFKSHTGMLQYSYLLSRELVIPEINQGKMLFQRYESNIEPHIRFMHMNNISSCGWVSIRKDKLVRNAKYSYCDHSYAVHWRNIKPAENDDRMAPFKIMGYDIECISCDHNFPQAERKTDSIIQIGITIYRYGSMQCEDQHILVLGKCAPIKDATVEHYNTERELLLGFARKVRELRPDFKAGYNNFDFDDKYIYHRIKRIDEEEAKKQGVDIIVMENQLLGQVLQIMGKVNNEYLMETEGLNQSLTRFEIKNLSSSALGDNILKFIQIPGILSVDMMKVIQRDHRLIGYKLDNVSANFITEKTINIIESEELDDQIKVYIYTRSTKALEKYSYIQIMVDDGYSPSPLSEGAKYKVLDIKTVNEEKDGTVYTFQSISTIIDKNDMTKLREVLKNPLLQIFWTFAKDDMHYSLINKYFMEENAQKVKQVAKYCLKDCKLVNLLLAKLEIIINSVGMAKVCHVPLSYLFLRGQGVKIFSLVSKKCREKGFLIPVLQKKEGSDDESYEGAIVIEPKEGIYLSPIAVLDYSALYPNSMRERNLSQECFVNNPIYDNLPGYIYHDIHFSRKNKNNQTEQTHYRFAQEIISDKQIDLELEPVYSKIKKYHEQKITEIKESHRGKEEKLAIDVQKEHIKNKMAEEKAKRFNIVNGVTVRYGILPEILTELLNKRKETNGRLREEKDPFMKAILNALQLAFKITANSLYGQTGAPTSSIYFLPIAASTTAIGRERLFFAKKIVEENFDGAKVVYGDSVTADTPMICRNIEDKISVTSIKSLGKVWEQYDQFKPNELDRNDKQQSICDYQIWSNDGWTKIKRVIRHRTVKKIYRIITLNGCVDVTEDHSLLDEDRQIIKPNQCEIGTKLLHGFPKNDSRQFDSISKKEAYIWGYYMESGTCSESNWFIENNNLETLNKCAIYLREIEKIQFEISTSDDALPIHRLIPLEKIEYLIKKYRLLFYPKQIKLVPNEILNAKHCLKQSFMDGYHCSSQITRSPNDVGSYQIDVEGKENTQCLFYILNSLEYQVGIDFIDMNQYRLSYSKIKSDKNENAIREIIFLGESNNQYVYDLETSDGTFLAGIGKIIVKNTDSIFINFHLKDGDGNDKTDKEALVKSIELAQEAEKIINARVPKPQSIVYEKTFYPFILIAKKKYVGLLYEKDPNKCSLKSMGIVLKRRDNAPIVKIIFGGIIDHILKNRDIGKAMEYIKEVLKKLMNGEYSIDKFIISKCLKVKYSKPSQIAHKVLADRMALRDPGNKPQINDRIPYVYIIKDIKKGTKKKKDILQGDLIEHPEFVVKNNLQIDYLFYLEHQIINPVSQLLELVMPPKEVHKIFRKYIIQENNRRNKCQSMEKWMRGHVVSDEPIKHDISYQKKVIDLPIGKKRKHQRKFRHDWLNTDQKISADDWTPSID